MAEIQMEYIEPYCDMDMALSRGERFCTQCCTGAANDLGCSHYYPGPTSDESHPIIIPFGDCKHVVYDKKYKGLSTKSYQMEEETDPFNRHLDNMCVTIRGKEYRCERVILDGKQIYPIDKDSGGEG